MKETEGERKAEGAQGSTERAQETLSSSISAPTKEREGGRARNIKTASDTKENRDFLTGEPSRQPQSTEQSGHLLLIQRLIEGPKTTTILTIYSLFVCLGPGES